ncbi:MAG: FMN-binding protein [Actinomycetia bacterium]|nr:FMN-binding protein [Actinomycetes bacterium]
MGRTRTPAWLGVGSVVLGGLAGCQGTPAATPAAPSVPVTPVALHDGTFLGTAVTTPRGDVQVRITVGGGRIDDIQVVTYPSESPTSKALNARAVPKLVAEGLAAQSADVDTVTGATYTSTGYRGSLQSAIDQAGR